MTGRKKCFHHDGWKCGPINMYFPPRQGNLSLSSLFLPLGFPHPYNSQAFTETAAS